MKLKGVFVTQEEAKPIKVSLLEEGSDSSDLFVYGTDLETVKSMIEKAFGLGPKKERKKKTEAVWGEEATSQPKRRGRKPKVQETEKELVEA